MLITPFSYCQFEKFPIITEILVFLELALGLHRLVYSILHPCVSILVFLELALGL